MIHILNSGAREDFDLPKKGQLFKDTNDKTNCNYLLNKQLVLKDAPSGLRQLLATESSLKMMRNAFYVTLKRLFVLKIFKVLVMHKIDLSRNIRFI